MRHIVISAVNLVEGGPLTVLRDCVRAAEAHADTWRVTVLVNDVRLIDARGSEKIAYPAAKKSWLLRLWHEWFRFAKDHDGHPPDVWLSLHDITPRVRAGKQFVYCHNPSPFYRIRVREALQDPGFLAFNAFYGLLYRLNIRRNAAVIVQQEWLRDAFMARYPVARVIVAHPRKPVAAILPKPFPQRISRFIYPAFPRVFKNFELIGEAATLLAGRPGWTGEIRLTMDGCENRYARWIGGRFGKVPGLCFIGLQDREAMAREFDSCDCLVFPSRLETWGLPISEAQQLGKPILAADLPYARETVGTYDRVRFFPADDPGALADAIFEAHVGGTGFGAALRNAPVEPFAPDWDVLMSMILSEDRDASRA